MSITTAQIRGARGILNWSQSDLAERTGISATSIGSIENGQSTPRANTIATIQRAFENAGLEFIGLDGLKVRSGDVHTYSGKNGFLGFYEDVYNTLKDNPTEVLVSNVDERVFLKWLGEFKDTHAERMKSIPGLNFKILIREGDDYIPAEDFATYRSMPKELFASVPFYCYGEKLALILFQDEPTIIVMNYPAINAAYRVQFYDIWERSKELLVSRRKKERTAS
jgi:transcriptional regulator with XRE-family HTH domain